MIPKNEIIDVAKERGVQPRIIEKDYILGWMLAAINNLKETQGKWIFKGGTCLKKCYFREYRFSEDLDFTVTDGYQLNALSLQSIIDNAINWINQYTGIEILKERKKITIKESLDEQKRYAEIRIYYIGPLEQKRNFEKIILYLSSFEQLFVKPEKRPILYEYSDFDESIFHASSYCFHELFAEKLRALIQRARPRDLYDVINLYNKRALLDEEIDFLYLLRQKFAHKNVSFEHLWEFSTHLKYQEMLNEWNSMLAHQLPNLNPIEEYLKDLVHVQEWVKSLEAKSIILPPTIKHEDISISHAREYLLKLDATNGKNLYHIILSQEFIDNVLTNTLISNNLESRQRESIEAIIKKWPFLLPIIRKKFTQNIVENRWADNEYITTVILHHSDK